MAVVVIAVLVESIIFRGASAAGSAVDGAGGGLGASISTELAWRSARSFFPIASPSAPLMVPAVVTKVISAAVFSPARNEVMSWI